MSNPKKKSQYLQSYIDSYSVDFPCVKKSSLGPYYAFCTVCSSDFKICHGGRNDIQCHVRRQKHLDRAKHLELGLSKINTFFPSSSSETDNAVIKAECLFINFLIEHNIPLSVADHCKNLFQKMFPDSSIAKKFSCGRTKSTSIIGVLASERTKYITNMLQNVPFSIGVDGSNDTDSKMHPIIVTYFNENTGKIDNCLFALNPITKRSTGENIASTILEAFEKHSIPFKNCIAFGADNAPVMLGKNKGVVSFLKGKNEELIEIGCSCHLINLAVRKAAMSLPIDIEQFIIDIFYFLEKSANRKESLKVFQHLHNTEVRKLLKHVPTRWLSLNKCLSRLVEQWTPLLSFFLQEAKKSQPETSVPVSSKMHSVVPDGIPDETDYDSAPKKKAKLENNESISKGKVSLTITKEEKIFYFLSAEENKAYAYFLLHVIPEFENKNAILQSSAPYIHKLTEILLDLLKNTFLKFIKPSVLKTTDLLKVDFSNKENQKNDSDLSIGNDAYEIVKKMNSQEQKRFYYNVRKYYTALSAYMVKKFPLQNDYLVNADIVNLEKIDMQSFDKIRYFISKFPFLLKIKAGENESVAMDKLQEQFNALQAEDISKVLTEERADIQVHTLSKMKNVEGNFKFDRITNVMKAVLLIPHSNANCERLFSLVKKNRTMFRSSLSDSSLEKLLILKTESDTVCYNMQFSNELLKKAKKATSVNL